MLAPVNISDGQVSGVSDLSAAASSVVNWEIDEAGVNVPRPPLVSYSITGLSASPIMGLEFWKDYVIAVTEDRYIYTIAASGVTGPDFATGRSTTSTATQLGGVAPRATFVGGDLFIYIAGGGQVQKWSPSLATSAILTNSPLCTHIASLGQRLIANSITDSSIIQWSDIGEGAWTTWPAANYSTADASPDPIVALATNITELFVWGSTSCQVYQVGSDPTLPFELVSTTRTGIAAPYAYVALDGGQFAFLDDKRRIVIGDGRSVETISDPIQKDLRELDTLSDCWAYREERGQQSLLVFRFPTAMRTFVYDMKGKRWTERKYYSAPAQADWPVTAYVYWPNFNFHLFGADVAAGGLYRIDDTTRQELSGPLVCERITGWHDHGITNRKRSIRLRATMRRGTAAEGATPGALELRRQCDNGPWSTWKQISVGGPEDYKQTQDVFMGGVFRRCRYQLRFSTSEQTALVALYDDVVDLGSP